MKMMFKVQVIVSYKSEHPTTRRNNSVAGESNFCRFLEKEAPKQSKLVKKAFFKTYWDSFLTRRKFSTYFLITLCIWKIIFKIQGNFWYNLEHHTTCQNDSAAAESNFCRFLENEVWKSVKYFLIFLKICPLRRLRKSQKNFLDVK